MIKRVMTLMLSLAMVFTLVSCGNKEKKEAEITETEPKVVATTEDEHEHEAADDGPAEDVQLSDWNGDWNGLTHYLDMDEVAHAYEELAEKRQSDVETVKADFKEEVNADYDALLIDGNKVTYYAAPKAENGKEIETVEYEYVQAHPMTHGGQTYYWYEFKATEDGSAHPIILLMDVHGESVMAHFHMRYGDDVDTILKMEDWYPTFFKPDVSMDQIAEEIAE